MPKGGFVEEEAAEVSDSDYDTRNEEAEISKYSEDEHGNAPGVIDDGDLHEEDAESLKSQKRKKDEDDGTLHRRLAHRRALHSESEDEPSSKARRSKRATQSKADKIRSKLAYDKKSIESRQKRIKEEASKREEKEYKETGGGKLNGNNTLNILYPPFAHQQLDFYETDSGYDDDDTDEDDENEATSDDDTISSSSSKKSKKRKRNKKKNKEDSDDDDERAKKGGQGRRGSKHSADGSESDDDDDDGIASDTNGKGTKKRGRKKGATKEKKGFDIGVYDRGQQFTTRDGTFEVTYEGKPAPLNEKGSIDFKCVKTDYYYTCRMLGHIGDEQKYYTFLMNKKISPYMVPKTNAEHIEKQSHKEPHERKKRLLDALEHDNVDRTLHGIRLYIPHTMFSAVKKKANEPEKSDGYTQTKLKPVSAKKKVSEEEPILTPLKLEDIESRIPLHGQDCMLPALKSWLDSQTDISVLNDIMKKTIAYWKEVKSKGVHTAKDRFGNQAIRDMTQEFWQFSPEARKLMAKRWVELDSKALEQKKEGNPKNKSKKERKTNEEEEEAEEKEKDEERDIAAVMKIDD